MDIDQLKAYITLLNSLADQLDDMADAASGDEQTAIATFSDGIRQYILALDVKGLAANSPQLLALQPKVAAVNTQLTTSQKQINAWATTLGDVNVVAGILDKALQLGIKLLG